MSQPTPTDDGITFHKHSPGDGLHPINDNVETLADGKTRKGDPSDICIVANAHTLCSVFGLPTLDLLWTEAFPDDPMSATDLSEIVESAKPYLNEFDPLLPETRSAIISDLRAIKCDKLADEIEKLLKVFDQTEKLLDEKKTPSD